MSVGVVDKTTGDRIPTAGNPLDKVGNLANLTTTAKGNAVEAINEVNATKANQTQLATVEASTTASKAYSANDYLVLGGVLYKVTANIAHGGTIVTEGAGKNVDLATVGGELSAINSNIIDLEENKGIHTSAGVWSAVTYGTCRIFIPFNKADQRTIAVNSAYVYSSNAMTEITDTITVVKFDSGFEIKTTNQTVAGSYGSITYTIS